MGNWNMTVNLAGSKPVDPTRFIDVPDGAYKVECISADRVEKDGKSRIDVKVRHTEAATQGAQHVVFLHLDFTKDFNKNHLATAMLSKGAKMEQLQQALNLSDDSFVGKTFHVHVQNKPGEVDEKGRKPFPDVLFITPELYAELKGKAGNGASKGAAQTAAPAGMGAVASAVGGQAAPPNI